MTKHLKGQAVVAGNLKADTQGPSGGGGQRKNEKSTHEARRHGWLKNGNAPGDFSKAPRCGAKNRRGTPCQCPMANGRCRLHGGLSTGPKTAEGIERIRRAKLKHGRYTKQVKAERAEYREVLRVCRKMLAGL